jgi:hypothetical protein
MDHLKSKHEIKLDETRHLVFPEQAIDTEKLINIAEASRPVVMKEEVRLSKSIKYSYLCNKCEKKFTTQSR